MTQDPNMMYESTYGPYHVHTWYIHLYALRGYTGVYTCIYIYVYIHVHMMYNILDVMSCLDMVPKGLNIQICPISGI